MGINEIKKVVIRSPNDIEEECAQFVIEDVTSPYLFGGVAKAGEKYTFSSYMRSEGNGSVRIGKQLLDVGTEWKRQFVTFEAIGTDVELYFNNPGTYYFFETQLEIGSTMTDWRPAVEDTEEGMKDLDNKFEEYATVTQLNSSIEASASEINATVSAVRTSVGELDTRVESAEARLELKVDSETLISEINASADVITLNGNRFVVNSDNLKITEDGTINAINGVFNGEINAQTGKIGIFKIEEDGYLSVESNGGAALVLSNSYVGDSVGEESYHAEFYPGNTIYTYYDLDGNRQQALIDHNGMYFYDDQTVDTSEYTKTDCTICGEFKVYGVVDPTYNGRKLRHAGDIIHVHLTASDDWITFWKNSTYFTTTNVDFYYDNATGRVEIFGIGKIGSSLSSEWGFTLCKIAKAEFQPKRIVPVNVAPVYAAKVVAGGVAYTGGNADNPGELRAYGRTAIGANYLYFSCSYYVDAGLMS